MRVSFNDFLEFTTRQGTPKLTFIRELKSREPYDPRKDFWKGLRGAVQRFHRHNKRGLPTIEHLVASTNCQSRKALYAAVAIQYLALAKGREVQSFTPPASTWTYGELTVGVSPEVALLLDGEPLVLKWFFRARAIRADQMREASFLLPHVLESESPPGTRFGILRRTGFGDNLIPVAHDPALLGLLEADALAFVRLWNAIQVDPRAVA